MACPRIMLRALEYPSSLVNALAHPDRQYTRYSSRGLVGLTLIRHLWILYLFTTYARGMAEEPRVPWGLEV